MVKIAKPQKNSRLRIFGERGRRGTTTHVVILSDGATEPKVMLMPFETWIQSGGKR